jgi:lauroyl/myristoyl acyltransferase
MLWALLLALDRLPWPWGEEILSHCFVASVFMRTKRLRRALALPAVQPGTGRGRWRLVRSLCAEHGRVLARSALVGIRNVEALRRLVLVRGAEHLAGPPGRILLGFHLGPSLSSLALRIAGHRVTWIGSRNTRPAWPREIRERYESRREILLFSEGRHGWAKRLYRARQLVTRGEDVFMIADGQGPEAFSIPLPVGSIRIQEGWLALRRTTGASVLPVLSHFEGRTQVVTIHPTLPPVAGDRVLDLEVCRRALGDLLGDYVRRFPDQCYSLVFQHGGADQAEERR